MNLREAAQQALEALDSMYGRKPERVEKVITALRIALAEGAMQRLTDVQQEMDCYGDGNVYRGQRSSDSKTQTITVSALETVEPVAWIGCLEGGIEYGTYHKAALKLPDGVRFDLYTAPPKREPLTYEELFKLGAESHEDIAYARAIERAHRIGGEE